LYEIRCLTSHILLTSPKHYHNCLTALRCCA
jgi:hypothetical protein